MRVVCVRTIRDGEGSLCTITFYTYALWTQLVSARCMQNSLTPPVQDCKLFLLMCLQSGLLRICRSSAMILQSDFGVSCLGQCIAFLFIHGSLLGCMIHSSFWLWMHILEHTCRATWHQDIACNSCMSCCRRPRRGSCLRQCKIRRQAAVDHH